MSTQALGSADGRRLDAGLATVFFSRRGDALPEDLSRSNLIVITSLPELLQYV